MGYRRGWGMAVTAVKPTYECVEIANTARGLGMPAPRSRQSCV
ncbi:MAG TPA: hypothetical protein V6D23_26965 [Candidatus Obscuribacterales bacterium]